MSSGTTQKFQEIRDAYEILTHYMENFRFVFDEQEFKQQNPILVSSFDKSWIKSG
jgi:DnaJ-class molecular chaperone